MKKYILSACLLIASPSVLAEDIYAPTKDEYGLIGNDVFVFKHKPANVVISSYHKWENVWSSNLRLRVYGENPDNVYRALAISVPLHLGGPGDSRNEIPYSGFVAAVTTIGGDTRAIPMNKVEWITASTLPLKSSKKSGN